MFLDILLVQYYFTLGYLTFHNCYDPLFYNWHYSVLLVGVISWLVFLNALRLECLLYESWACQAQVGQQKLAISLGLTVNFLLVYVPLELYFVVGFYFVVICADLRKSVMFSCRIFIWSLLRDNWFLGNLYPNTYMWNKWCKSQQCRLVLC